MVKFKITFIAFIVMSYVCNAQQKDFARSSCVETSVPPELDGGLPISNFAIAAQIPRDGHLFGHVWSNTGKLGRWLTDCGELRVSVNSHSVASYTLKEQNRNFPIVTASYKGYGIRFTVEAFCPVVAQDEDDTALPVIMLQVRTSRPSDVGVSLPRDFYRYDGPDGRMAIVRWDPSWTASARFDGPAQAGRYVIDNWDRLKAQTLAFSDALPRVGDALVDSHLQYYLLPSLILTRINNQGVALTMGYNELNQRDSYWTSWMHLVNFRDLEWKMIEESYGKMTDSGKIPTTIYPRIDRKDDLDINLFLILRTARYMAYWADTSQLPCLWPRMKMVMDWVVGRDFGGNGLPEQVSTWCDWKDVSYMDGRRYSPFVAMLYLASLDQMRKMAVMVGDTDAASRYEAIYSKAYEFANRSTAEGGLWNGRYYAQVMKDGSVWPQITEDQMVGVIYGVIPQDRAESIIAYLDEYATTGWGVCVMWPYLDGAADAGGYYHNGAMWPWVGFMDCWARIRCGHKASALDLAGTIIKADLVDSGDYVPNEHVSTVTGINHGFPIQGWNADLYGLLYFACNPSARYMF